MLFNQTEKQEKEYLKQVITTLIDTLSTVRISVKEHVDTLQEYKDYLWSNKDIDPHEIRSMRESILTHFALGENVIGKHKRLSRILDIPYFGRIDFKEKKEGSSVMPLYIGIHTFYDAKSKTNLIHDWRAPISSMFYEYELGEASYNSPVGGIMGAISLKRQYRIRNGKMEYMLESSLAIHDHILQKELTSNADDKMRNIIATIQREQNHIIRTEGSRDLIIQGVAGSGKTSIALHRIAYLLYAFQGSILSKDILIISPNKVFADYISNVLPELGEAAVPETSMEQILSGVLGHTYNYQNFFEQVAVLLAHPEKGFIDRIQYKASFDFIAQLDRFIMYVENNYFRATDVQLTKHVTVPAAFIDAQFKRFNRYPMRQRFDAMTNYILETMKVTYRFSVTGTERNALKKEIRKMFAGNNDIRLYKDFFEWAEKPGMYKMCKNRTLEYADLAPLAYLHLALEGSVINSRVKHLLIDEMQDYSPIQYRVVQRLYPCRKTVLGDVNQSVNPYGSSTPEKIQKVFATGEVMKLCKSYRSTYEITNFAQKIRANEELDPVSRQGEQPKVLVFKTEEEEISGIVALVAAFKRSEYKSLGIICKTEAHAKETAESLKAHTDHVHFLSHKSSAFVKGILVTSAHMAKGLEFDEVIVPQADDKNYASEIDRSMLYVAVTRAMHRLTVTYCGTVTRYIANACKAPLRP